MRELLYDVEWQVLRMGCTERFQSAGGWATVDGVKQNLDKLDDYLRVRDEMEYAVRQFRVNHYLAWVESMLFRQNKQDLLDDVSRFRIDYTKGYDVILCRDAADNWSWSKVVYDLVVLRRKDEEVFNKLYGYMSRRYGRGKVQAELDQFLMMMTVLQDSVAA